MRELTATNVEDTLKRVEAPSVGSASVDAIKVDGIVNRYAFHPGRLAEAKQEIGEMLSQLPIFFHPDKGGGWSFLNGAVRQDGVQWGEHQDIERLVCMGIATEQAQWIMKDMAASLPGGVPYFQVMV